MKSSRCRLSFLSSGVSAHSEGLLGIMTEEGLRWCGRLDVLEQDAERKKVWWCLSVDKYRISSITLPLLINSHGVGGGGVIILCLKLEISQQFINF